MAARCMYAVAFVLLVSGVHGATLRGSGPAAAVAAASPKYKRCVFLHGTGVTTTEPASNSFESYWGNIQDYTKQCSEHWFIHQDTTTRAFDDPAVMEAYCGLASEGTGTVTDSIVFSHSYGNAAFAAAIQHGYCDIDKNSSSWYEVSGPLRGSKAADWAGYICSHNSTIDEALRMAARLMNYCQETSDKPNLAYLSMETTYPGLKGLPEIAAARISGAMCGTSPFGLVSEYSIPLEALSKLAEFPGTNDGMVGLTSCQVHSLSGSYKDAFYEAAINHVDATGRNGNGDFDDPTRQPVQWYSLRT